LPKPDFLHGSVTDFMNLGIQNLRKGIFNVADVCVTAGVIRLILYRNEKNKIQGNANY